MQLQAKVNQFHDITVLHVGFKICYKVAENMQYIYTPLPGQPCEIIFHNWGLTRIRVSLASYSSYTSMYN